MKRNVISIVTLIAILTAVLCGAAFAENENYSYNKGKQENTFNLKDRIEAETVASAVVQYINCACPEDAV